MKLIYIANARIPTEKAHGIQIMKMCEAFSLYNPNATNLYPNAPNDYKIEVELVLPKRRNHIKENPFQYYGVNRNFKIKKLFCLDLVNFFSPIGFWIETLTFSFSVFIYLLFKKINIIYSRNLLAIYWLSFFRKNIFYEIHGLPHHFSLYQGLLKRIKGLISITQTIKIYLIEKGIKSNKVLVVPDGVDIENFDIDFSQKECRKKLNLPIDKKIVLYTGHLYDWKGVNILAQAAEYLEKKYLVVFVGGTDFDLRNFKAKFANCKNILMAGHRSYKEIPYWLKAADVLVLPNSAEEKISKYWTSPLKMFEYMTSKRPIIASDLPSIREVLNQKNSILINSNNSQELIEGIKKALRNHNFSVKISQQAYKDVQNYTWQKRIKRIINFIKQKV